MKKIFGNLKVKVLILVALLGLTFHLGWNVSKTKACQRCVTLTGGLCVGCQAGYTNIVGYRDCEAIQETCSCNVSGSNCGKYDRPPFEE